MTQEDDEDDFDHTQGTVREWIVLALLLSAAIGALWAIFS